MQMSDRRLQRFVVVLLRPEISELWLRLFVPYQRPTTYQWIKMLFAAGSACVHFHFITVFWLEQTSTKRNCRALI